MLISPAFPLQIIYTNRGWGGTRPFPICPQSLLLPWKKLVESGYKKKTNAEPNGSGGLCSRQPERRESLNSSNTLLTCPKQNIWHPWKSHPAKGCSWFIPHSSQQNRARASRTWLSKKDEFLQLGVGSFCRLLPLNQEFALRLLWCELCSIPR